MIESKATFRAMRERLGLTQQDVADAVGVRVLAVKRWERPGFSEPPEDAWEHLEVMVSLMEDMVEFSVGKARELTESTGAVSVVLTYFRDQEQYDASGRDDGPYGFANAISREVGAVLTDEGIEVEFAYPDDGAVRTPGSRY